MSEIRGTIINACDTRSYNEKSRKCRKCNYKEYCERKKILSCDTPQISWGEQQVKIPMAAVSAEEMSKALINFMKGEPHG